MRPPPVLDEAVSVLELEPVLVPVLEDPVSVLAVEELVPEVEVEELVPVPELVAELESEPLADDFVEVVSDPGNGLLLVTHVI
mmetsp:Transcript_17826/g.23984  ORF Transcript_17826/g.23984 Transcript_17826/m.23984 type:complete len:83 (+) Transcript_17826:150-398(+)